jgi:urease accessory protein UreE
MSTVQLAIRNQRYAAALADLLQHDGSHRVVFAEKPDLKVDGIIVLDGNKMENLLLFEAQPERFVVITRKDAGLLARVWDAGVRHVVFEEDAPSLAMLAVIAAELRGSSATNKPSANVFSQMPGALS